MRHPLPLLIVACLCLSPFISLRAQSQPSQPSLLFQSAMRPVLEKAQKGDYAGALQTLDSDILPRFPKTADTYTYRGYLLQNLNRLEEALAAYVKCTELTPENPEAWYNRSRLEFGLRKNEDARRSADTCIRLAPPIPPDVYLLRGDIREAMGDTEGALADYTKMIELNPGSGTAFASRGKIHYDRQEYLLARSDFTSSIMLGRGLAASPEYHKRALQSYGWRALAKINLSDETGSDADLAEAVKWGTQSQAAHFYEERAKFWMRHRQESLPKALRDLDKVIELNPERGHAYSLRAKVGIMLIGGEPEDKERIKTDLALAEKHGCDLSCDDYCMALMMFRGTVGDIKGTLAPLQALLERNSFSKELALQLAHAHMAHANYAEVLAALDAGDEKIAARADVLALRVECYYRLGRHAEAVPFLAELLKNPETQITARIWQMAGIIRLKTGDDTGGIAALEKALALQPDWPPLLSLLGRAYHDTGRLAQALPLLEKANPESLETAAYCQLYLWLVRAKNNDTAGANTGLRTFLEKNATALDTWLSTLARFLLGEIDETALLQAAETAPAEKIAGQRCEACFYAAEKRLLTGDTAGTRALFQKCIATGQSGFQEYDSARRSLQRLESGPVMEE